MCPQSGLHNFDLNHGFMEINSGGFSLGLPLDGTLSCAQWGPCDSLHWSLGMMPLKMEFVLSALILSCFHSFVLSDSQGDALYALKNSLNASAKQLMDWNPNQVNPCTWSNVICDPSNNVISVTLSSMQLSGTLSPKIGILNTLSTLFSYLLRISAYFCLPFSHLFNAFNLIEPLLPVGGDIARHCSWPSNLR
ncbi:putative LRR receptor-like serine/threonine-protein kinase [Vitis vinifera]|uniref:Putative LRR receptor-like serine/threonine-protein kinase n=1 Tax=Vitis vinifera TaxID=29760 RepID=A0A438KQ47_VITVI|nr:putative LRR receptor-like serine/threonine-protein kinase [Vitis vinifera]